MTPWTAACPAPLSSPVSWGLLKFMCIESMMPSNHVILCCPFLLLPTIFPSIRVFSISWPFCIRWPNYWNFSFSTGPSSEYSGLISFRIDWFDTDSQTIWGKKKSHIERRMVQVKCLQNHQAKDVCSSVLGKGLLLLTVRVLGIEGSRSSHVLICGHVCMHCYI